LRVVSSWRCAWRVICGRSWRFVFFHLNKII
jgi:hypothetical protein